MDGRLVMSSSDPLPHLDQVLPAGVTSAHAKAFIWRNRLLQMIPVLLLLLVVGLALALTNAPAESSATISEVSLFLSMLFGLCCIVWTMMHTTARRARLAW